MTARFSDIQGHWAEDCIHQLAGNNIIQGYPDGQFKPDKTLTRAEFSALLQAAFPNAEETREPVIFNDLPEDHWAFTGIQFAYQTGFLSGYPEQVFKPDIPMLRVQAIAALSTGWGYVVPENAQAVLEQSFEDASEIPDYAVKAIAAAVQAELVVTSPDEKQLRPNEAITRAQLAALICQALRFGAETLEIDEGEAGNSEIAKAPDEGLVG